MSKNTHLEHLEDSLLMDGKQGALDAITFLDDLCSMFVGQPESRSSMTVKWDGSPAVFCGHYPGTSSFFVATKSLFNKDAKINYTKDDVKRNHGHASGLVAKLYDCLEYIPRLQGTDIYQGDLLFTDDAEEGVIDGRKCIIFTPNKITYCIPEGDELYDKARKAKLCVVFHTQYVGNSIESLSARFGGKFNLNYDVPEVLVISADMAALGTKDVISEREIKKYRDMRKETLRQIEIAGDLMDLMSEHINSPKNTWLVGPQMKIFFNKFVRDRKPVSNPDKFAQEFCDWWNAKLGKEIAGKKQPKSISKYKLHRRDGREIINNNMKELAALVTVYKSIQDAKLPFIDRLGDAQGRFGTFFRDGDGFKVTKPEGYVAIQYGTKAYKLVDRLTFSAENLNKSPNI
tara:strand:- start:621 stop:1826 length:1206 start_codon:yes stop_codon:yes gene_type:complete